MGPWGAEGIRLIKIAEFPFIRSSERREMAWLQHSLSSLPVCLARAWAIFFTSCAAVLCQPPRDSKARGMKLMPCLSQSSAAPLIFLSKAKLRPCPGVTAASATVACCRGLTTVISRAASQPADQLGSKTSARRRSLPGRRKRPSFCGLSTAPEAILKIWSRRSLCLAMRSPQNPQQRAWSPNLSLGNNLAQCRAGCPP